jgi:excisionase family DNA binding protein
MANDKPKTPINDKMHQVTFNEMPQMLELIYSEILQLKEELRAQKQLAEKPKDDADQYLTIEQVAEFLNLKTPTIYTKVYKREIPYHKTGRKLMFSKRELTNWILSSGKKKGGENE